MQDVVKTNVKRKQSSKRARRRRRKMSLYFLLVVFMIAGIGIALSMTLFFNVTNITIMGETEYSDEQIVGASGITVGENLVRLDTNAVARTLQASLLNVETVEVDKHFPSTVVLTLTKCVPSANIAYDGGYLLVSARGKILASVAMPDSELLTIAGYEPESIQLGQTLQSVNAQKTSIYTTFFDTIQEKGYNEIVSIDMTDEYDIIVNYEDRVEFEIGNFNEIPYKLTLAEAAIAELNAGKQYNLKMIGSNQISVTQKETLLPVTTAPLSTDTTTTTTILP